MKTFSLLLSVLLVTCLVFAPLFAAAHEGHDHDHDHDHSHDAASAETEVVVLNKDSFKGQIESAPVTLVEFFAPWCGHCKSLAPNFAKASVTLKDKSVLASVDCTVEKDLCEQFGVKGFPTLKVFSQSTDNPSDYNGGRTADEIVTYMTKLAEPAFAVLNTQAEVDEFVNKDGVEILAFMSEDSDDGKIFTSVANKLRFDYSFALVKNVDAAKSIIPSASDNQIVIVKSKTDNVAYTGDLNADAIAKFISDEAFPLVGEIGPENYQKYMDRKLSMIWFFVDEAADSTKDLLAAAETVAAEFKGRVSVVKLDGVRWAEHAKHFGLPGGKLPGIVAEDHESQKNFIFSGEPTVEALRAHFQGFLDKTLPVVVKSQPVPEDNSAPVKVLVGSTFEDLVINNDKDVFVEFYAPWCGHCKTLAPKYDELGARFADNDKVVIAKVDATENDTPAAVAGFPTLFLYPSGDKTNPIKYEGERSTDAMYDWIQKNGKTFSAADSTDSSNHDDL